MSYRTVDTNILDVVDVDNDTFQVFIEKVNWIVDHMRHTVVTVSNTNAYDGNNAGNGFVTGIFGGTVLVAGGDLRGGNVSTSNTLLISSSTRISNTLHVVANLTANATTSLRILNVSGTTIISNTLTVSSNVAFGEALTVEGPVSANSPVTIKVDHVLDTISNTNIGSNTTSPQTIYSFAKTSFNGGKILLQTKNGSNSQIYEAVFTHNGSDPGISTYGVISAPSTANNGVLSGGSNTTHILIRYQQTSADTLVKAALQLVK